MSDDDRPFGCVSILAAALLSLLAVALLAWLRVWLRGGA